jgi:hypothetical protein
LRHETGKYGAPAHERKLIRRRVLAAALTANYLRKLADRPHNFSKELSAGRLPRPPLKRLVQRKADRRHAACRRVRGKCGKRRAARSARMRGLAAAHALR